MVTFLGKDSGVNSRFVIIPCPHEATTSYGKGTKNGPAAILKASEQVESFDEELHQETNLKAGIHTQKPVKASELARATLKVFKSGKIPIILGGEHSISPETVKAAKAVYPDLSVLHFDAHADLRDSYQGKKDSHACAARRMLEICPITQIGIRNISKEEMQFAQSSGQINKLHFAINPDSAKKAAAQLSGTVFISFDVDVFDPSIMPSTGTPEPGGLNWNEVLNIFREVCKNHKVIGADFVELSPIKGLHAPDFTIAKLIYKLIGYLSR